MVRTKKVNIRLFFLLLFLFLLVIFTIEGAAKLLHPLKYKELVIKYSAQYDIDPFLVFSIIKAESSFNVNATSYRSARGLMQITDDTGKWAAEEMGLKEFKIESLYDAKTNISIGCWYLDRLINQFDDGGELEEVSRKLVLAAYNAGPTRVDTWLKESGSEYGLQKIPYKETERYIKKVNNYYIIYKRIYD